MILKGSPYQNGTIVDWAVIGDDTLTGKELFRLDFLSIEDLGDDYDIYTTQQGDELDELSFRFYGDDRFWWILADVNDLQFIFDLEPNIKLIIPSENFVKKYA